jgi:hypothetical protein
MRPCRYEQGEPGTVCFFLPISAESCLDSAAEALA